MFPIISEYDYCNGETLWTKVEEKTELDLMKEKYASGDYIAIYKEYMHLSSRPYREMLSPSFNEIGTYKLIHKRHKDILYAYLANGSLEIEIRHRNLKYGISWKKTDFIEEYSEDSWYRIKPEIWIKTTTISLAMYTCYDARSDCWINPIICETMEECKIKLDESYFSLHTEIPNTRFETVLDKDRFEQNKWNTKLTDLTL